VRAIPEVHHAYPASPYAPADAITGQGYDRLVDQIELRAHGGGFSLVWTGSAVAQQNAAPAYSGTLNEAYHDSEWRGAHWSIGKKAMSWDVGLAFRPLDVVQQEDRRALYTFALDGIPVIAAEVLDADSAWTVLVANPGSGEARAARDDGSVAARYYRRIGSLDWYAVSRLSRRDRAQAGSSFSWVANESLEWHGSLLYQRRSEKNFNSLALTPGAPPLSASDPTVVREDFNAVLALAGGTWTNEAGWSFIAEGWYDGTAYRKSDWDALRALTARQLALRGRPGVPELAIDGNLAYSTRYYQYSNLLRENLLARVSVKIEKFTPSLDVLATPRDGGLVATASCGYEGDRSRVDAGLRVLGGRADSAYRRAPESRVFYIAGSFFLR
jgi:hypothetical protein